MPPTLSTPIIASTPSISIILRPSGFACRVTTSAFLARVPCCTRRSKSAAYWRTTSKPFNTILVLSAPLRTQRSNDGRVKCEAVILLLCWLLPKVSFFLPNPAKTCWTAEKVPLIRCSGFAERERDLCLAYFSSFFPLILSCFTPLFYTSRTP